MKKLLIIILSMLIISLLLPLSTVMAAPLGHLFYGYVTIDGSPAPNGTSVTATMSGYPDFDTTTTGDYYELIINADTADSGNSIDFYVEGIYADSDTFAISGFPEFTELDLSITSPLPDYTLTISTNGDGDASGAGTYQAGSVVSISADPDYGWEFNIWSGDTATIADVNDSTTTITMDDDYDITANFEQLPTFELTIDIIGEGTVDGEGDHPQGEEVNINAYPNEGWIFDFWSGDTATIADVNDASTTITMDDNYDITANFSEAETFTLTMVVNGSGTTSPPAGEHVYTEGTVVDIIATPIEGWEFVSWSGDVADSGSASTTVTIDADKTVTANFSQIGVTNYTLTISVNGNGSTSPAAGNYIYAEGTVVDISATPDEGWQFDGWSGDVADSGSASTTVTMNSNKTVGANFSLIPIPIYTLTILVNGSGDTTPAVGKYVYEEGTVVDISATPDEGWQFDGWSGDVADPGSASTSVIMDADKTVTAIFIEQAATVYTLTMAISGFGATNPSVGSHEYEQGTTVSISATPIEGWEFVSWSGDVADPDSASTSVTMDANKTVTANFNKKEDITPPAIPVVLATNISKTGADVFWITDEPSDSQVDYSASPGELTPLDTTLVTEHLVHLTGLAPATTYRYMVMSKDASGNLTVSDEYTFSTAGTPATFITSDWNTIIEELENGKDISISFQVTNQGDTSGTYQASLSINGEVEETKNITLDAGASQPVTFTTIQSVAGTYHITVNELALSVEVESGGGTN